MNILVATDGSEAALRGVRFAADLAQRLGSSSSITLISVHDDVGLRHAKSVVGSAAVEDHLREQSESEVAAARAFLDSVSVRHDIAIRTGHVSQEIVAFADAGAFDLIVVGSKGRGALADMLIGSVTQRVLASARQPVVVVK